jgi:hypothetical protein
MDDRPQNVYQTMETPTPFSVETALQRWRTRMSQVPGVSRDRLEELESHLRDSIDRLRAAGLAEDEAWMIAERRLGHSQALGTEFTKMEDLVAGAKPESKAAARNRSIIAIGAGFALTALVFHTVVYFGFRDRMASLLVILASLLGGCVTGAIANRFAIRHAFRAALILMLLIISLSLIAAGPFVFPWDPDFDPLDVPIFEQLWGRIWPSFVLGATMCIGAALVQGQRSATLRRYSRKLGRFIRERWSLSGEGAARIEG